MYVVELQNNTLNLNNTANFNITNIQLQFTLNIRKKQQFTD